eukprot:604578-Pyramimonas_sp.AAC.1
MDMPATGQRQLYVQTTHNKQSTSALASRNVCRTASKYLDCYWWECRANGGRRMKEPITGGEAAYTQHENQSQE